MSRRNLRGGTFVDRAKKIATKSKRVGQSSDVRLAQNYTSGKKWEAQQAYQTQNYNPNYPGINYIPDDPPVVVVDPAIAAAERDTESWFNKILAERDELEANTGEVSYNGDDDTDKEKYKNERIAYYRANPGEIEIL